MLGTVTTTPSCKHAGWRAGALPALRLGVFSHMLSPLVFSSWPSQPLAPLGTFIGLTRPPTHIYTLRGLQAGQPHGLPCAGTGHNLRTACRRRKRVRPGAPGRAPRGLRALLVARLGRVAREQRPRAERAAHVALGERAALALAPARAARLVAAGGVRLWRRVRALPARRAGCLAARTPRQALKDVARRAWTVPCPTSERVCSHLQASLRAARPDTACVARGARRTCRLSDASSHSASDAPSGRRHGEAEEPPPSAPAAASGHGAPAASAARRARSAARKRCSCAAASSAAARARSAAASCRARFSTCAPRAGRSSGGAGPSGRSRVVA